MRLTVYGLWHLGSVTAASVAEAGNDVVGLDSDSAVVEGLWSGRPPLFEPGLKELIGSGLSAGKLRFTTDAGNALRDADVLWVCIDTPVNDNDEADVAAVRAALDRIAEAVQPKTLVLISSQVPVGFTRSLARDWAARGCRFAYSPENLRLGKALDAFRKPERVVIGIQDSADQALLTRLFAPFCGRIEWMSLESAEMTKHALNAFLATSVTFINELARLCEAVGADAKEVERGLKSDGRIGPRAYLSPGAAFAGGTLARDVRFLIEHGEHRGVPTPLFRGVWDGNERHKEWLRESVQRLLEGQERPVVAILGLTYKPGTSTLRRSAAVELCRWLHARGAHVRAHDPAVSHLPEELAALMELAPEPLAAAGGADLVVVATEWPQYRTIRATDLVGRMRRPRVIDPNYFLKDALADDPRVAYVATGRAA
jgi:UDPglucose 6-dehydrogenase